MKIRRVLCRILFVFITTNFVLIPLHGDVDDLFINAAKLKIAAGDFNSAFDIVVRIFNRSKKKALLKEIGKKIVVAKPEERKTIESKIVSAVQKYGGEARKDLLNPIAKSVMTENIAEMPELSQEERFVIASSILVKGDLSFKDVFQKYREKLDDTRLRDFLTAPNFSSTYGYTLEGSEIRDILGSLKPPAPERPISQLLVVRKNITRGNNVSINTARRFRSSTSQKNFVIDLQQLHRLIGNLPPVNRRTLQSWFLQAINSGKGTKKLIEGKDQENEQPEITFFMGPKKFILNREKAIQLFRMLPSEYGCYLINLLEVEDGTVYFPKPLLLKGTETGSNGTSESNFCQAKGNQAVALKSQDAVIIEETEDEVEKIDDEGVPDSSEDESEEKSDEALVPQNAAAPEVRQNTSDSSEDQSEAESADKALAQQNTATSEVRQNTSEDSGDELKAESADKVLAQQNTAASVVPQNTSDSSEDDTSSEVFLGSDPFNEPEKEVSTTSSKAHNLIPEDSSDENNAFYQAIKNYVRCCSFPNSSMWNSFLEDNHLEVVVPPANDNPNDDLFIAVLLAASYKLGGAEVCGSEANVKLVARLRNFVDALKEQVAKSPEMSADSGKLLKWNELPKVKALANYLQIPILMFYENESGSIGSILFDGVENSEPIIDCENPDPEALWIGYIEDTDGHLRFMAFKDRANTESETSSAAISCVAQPQAPVYKESGTAPKRSVRSRVKYSLCLEYLCLASSLVLLWLSQTKLNPIDFDIEENRAISLLLMVPIGCAFCLGLVVVTVLWLLLGCL